MLRLEKITKDYQMGETKQKVLKGIDLNFRRKEFVSILGASGSGKTTLLNIIGGLDKYTSGDLFIEGVSTKKYKSEDWDSYRNNKIGFVFQSYNLISHLSLLSNVELSLTLSGISKKVRKEKAKKALEMVGLGDHINKLPKQLSGGQMQRVAIARAIVNDPEIILADEPTGALDSETSIQIMDILKELSKDKLVIMVTHNPELAKEYSTRIIELKDGLILEDSNPVKDSEIEKPQGTDTQVKTKKTSMSFFTSLKLSFRNLLTKRGRTILVSIAGSIGIIGIALILSLSNGVNKYVDNQTKNYLDTYPITLEKQAVVLDITSIIPSTEEVKADDGKIASTDDIEYLLTSSTNMVRSNNLQEFKKYLEENEDKMKEYTSEIRYEYDVNLQLYSNKDGEYVGTDINANGNLQYDVSEKFQQLSDDKDIIDENYDVVAGKLPENYNELVLVTDENGAVDNSLLYALNIRDRSELVDATIKLSNNQEINFDTVQYDYDDILNLTYKVVPNTDYYVYQDGVYQDKSKDKTYLKNIIDKDGFDVKIVGILKPKNDNIANKILGYPSSLPKHVMEINRESQIAKDQLANPEIDVFTGTEFDELSNSYEQNISNLGIASEDDPAIIYLFTKDKDAKDKVVKMIDDYNKKQKDAGRDDLTITYTDTMQDALSLLTKGVNGVTYVLIAFVAISLIVSSIMISIITYISVLERTKEIGILRAIGARKKDVSRVFNAETVIEGLISGVIGVAVTLLLNVVINLVVKHFASEFGNIATLSAANAVILIVLSVIITMIAGLIPSRMASKKEPVEALRSE